MRAEHAEDFEKDYAIENWNESDKDYLEEINNYASKKLIACYGYNRLKVGDQVKVISSTSDASDRDHKKEYIPVGTICKVSEVCRNDDGSEYYGVTAADQNLTAYYLYDELERGHMEWVADE